VVGQLVDHGNNILSADKITFCFLFFSKKDFTKKILKKRFYKKDFTKKKKDFTFTKKEKKIL